LDLHYMCMCHFIAIHTHSLFLEWKKSCNSCEQIDIYTYPVSLMLLLRLQSNWEWKGDYRIKLGPEDRMTLGITLLVYKTLDGWLTYLLWLLLKNFWTCCRLLQILAICYFLGGDGAREVEL
jgi:hypothetical protein